MKTEYILNDTHIRVTVVFVNPYINFSCYNTVFASFLILISAGYN
jgi:hypothetical protein